MKVHLIKEKTIEKFVSDHARSAASFAEWLRKLKGADWKSPADIRDNYPTADFLGNGCPG